VVVPIILIKAILLCRDSLPSFTKEDCTHQWGLLASRFNRSASSGPHFACGPQIFPFCESWRFIFYTRFITPSAWSRVLDIPVLSELAKKFLVSYETKVHYRVHKSSPLVSTLSQVNLVHIFTPCLRSILIVSHLRLGLPYCPFHSGFLATILTPVL
jgi:hypothetical protein